MAYRMTCWLLVASLAAGVAAAQQQPPAQSQPPAQPPALKPLHPRVVELLARWERESVGLESVYVEIESSSQSAVFNKPFNPMAGYAKFMKLPDGTYGARLELKDVQNPNRYQKFICTGKDLYQFEPEQKKIMVNALPARQKNQAPDDGPLPFLFGMKADVARQRYDFEVLEDKKNPAAAQWYTYLSVIPKDPRDRADFTTATLSILNKATPTIPQDMPAQIRWIEPNKNQVTWNIKKLERNGLGPANRADFARPEVPAGWQLVQAQPAAAGGPPQGAVPGVPAGNPRVIRNQNPN